MSNPMAESFGEYVAPTDAIRDILRGYPFSIGLFREILQNSDDAGARKQTFILDHRNHPTYKLYNDHLADYQGPALLAFNDGILQEKDWNALRNIHKSSKISDKMWKIGKFGLGFRSCYHVTDIPHILSGSHLAILDPQHLFSKDGGVRLNIVDNTQQFKDHLVAFDALLPRSQWGSSYSGSIFRFPLRMTPSGLSNKTISTAEIAELLRSFAREELGISLLFLRNISTIEIFEITACGERLDIASASVDRTEFEDYGAQFETRKFTIRMSSAGSTEDEEWRIIHAPFSEAQAVESLRTRLGKTSTHTDRTILGDKLNPTIDLAIPSRPSILPENGRLFTFLPLPLKTGFPVHVNALFSLTQSRQNLRNADEIGIVSDSEDRVRIEWNRLLFDTYVPQAWAMLLKILVQEDHIPNVFSAWPKHQADVQSGDAMNWKDMPLHVAAHALKLPVWPIFGTNPPLYQNIASLVVEERSIDVDDIVAALVRTGVQITRLPQYLTRIIMDNFRKSIKVLSPEVAYGKLQLFVPQIRGLDDRDINTILTYLLSTANCELVIGLPLVPSVSGHRITLVSSRDGSKPHILFDETEEELFAEYDPEAISLKQLALSSRNALTKEGTSSLNVAELRPFRVINYLSTSVYSRQLFGFVSEDKIRWLNVFWVWARATEFLRYANRFFLVPTTQGTQNLTDNIFDPREEIGITHILEELDVAVIDPRLEPKARQALRNLRSDIHSLLGFISLESLQQVDFSEADCDTLCVYLVKYLPIVNLGHKSIATDDKLSLRLRGLPIYPVLSYSGENTLSIHRSRIPPLSSVRGLYPGEVQIIPALPNVSFLDLTSIGEQFLAHLDPVHAVALSTNDMHELMLNNFTTQTSRLQLAFIQYLTNSSYVPRKIRDQLSTIRFVPTRDGAFQAPAFLVDPNSLLADLFPDPTPALPSLSNPILVSLVDLLRDFGLFLRDLTPTIVRERIESINSRKCPNPERVAHALIHLLNDAKFDPQTVFLDPDFPSSLQLRWIPTTHGLKNPSECRDKFSHHGKTDLFDEAMPLVNANIHVGPQLRSLFGWNESVSTDIILKQLIEVVGKGAQAPFQKVFEIVNVLGTCHHPLPKPQFLQLRNALRFKNWVPTRNGTVEGVSFVLLGDRDVPRLGFHTVAFDSLRYSKVQAFLRVMGCVERPTKDSILYRLQLLYTGQPGRLDIDTTQGVIQLLSWLPRLNADDQKKLFVPDDNGYLHPFSKIFFNDIGEKAVFHDVDSGGLAHSSISPDLASDLGLQRLGLLGVQDQSTEFNIGEGWVVAIRDRLQGYTDPRVVLDLLSLASDAGATRVDILLDEASGPTRSLLSPRCHDVQCSPAFVIHYNGTFDEAIIEDMLSHTGTGGYNGKVPLGAFGLGALSMFHVTEFPTIVSRDQIWFMDPTKSHLGVDKAILRLPLSTVRRSYGDHLSPFLNLFDFTLPEDVNEHFVYNDTIIRLPLRTNSQVTASRSIFTKTTTLQSLASHLKSLAPNCLFFTSFDSIRLHRRQGSARGLVVKTQEAQLQWEIRGTREDFSRMMDGIDVHTVTINHVSSMRASEVWRVLSLRTSRLSLPPDPSWLEKHYRLDRQSFVHVAACISSSANSPRGIFTTLPHSINHDLPIHISCPFILTPDKTSVRIDDPREREYSYNHWLLTSVVPTIYLCLLEDRALIAENTDFWPGNSKVEPEVAPMDISTLVGDAVYQMALAPTTNNAIFRSKFHPVALSTQSARFILRVPRAVLTALEATSPLDVAQVSSSITRRLHDLNSPQFLLVTPKYVHAQLSSDAAKSLVQTLNLEQVQEVIDFLSRDADAFGCLSGLSILPLDDGTFGEFGLASSIPCFYVPPPEVYKASIFKPNRLVHRNFTSTRLLEIDRLNVKPITENSIKNLLDDQISASETIQGADTIQEQWIKSFWKVFSSLKIQPTSIGAYPLVPTLKQGYYLSLSYCKTSAILADFTQHLNLRQSLLQMGMTLVNTATLPSELRTALPPSALSVESVLAKIIGRGPAEIPKMFGALDSKTRPYFIGWVRSDWQRRKGGYFRAHPEFRILPIWATANGSYVAANEAQMLPNGITVESIGPFASKIIVGRDLTLEFMGLRSPPSVRSLLQIPNHLEEKDDKAYKTLLQEVLFAYTNKDNPIPVPNSQRQIRDSTTMYSSRDDLFTAAFGSSSERFVHKSFVQFEERLEKHGLKRQRNLSIPLFRSCVEVFHTPSGDFLQERAAVLFNIWSQDLPLRLNVLNQDQLNTLDDLRFIARHMTPRPLGSADDNRYIRPLPDIVSPNELVKTEFQAIAWTQRALYKTQPHSNVLKIHPQLSTPTAQEVVNHLVVLATKVAVDHDNSCLLTLIEHLERTYEWLNTHTKDAKPFLEKCKDDELAIFLNAEAPEMVKMEDWTWKRAEHILLNNDFDAGHLQYPRAFIKSFRSLLETAGAVSIDYGKEVKSSFEPLANEDRYSALCSSLNQMRKNTICTDVTFTFDLDDGEPLVAHRTYLAAYSKHFLELFSKSDLADAKLAVVPLCKPYTKRAAKILLDYAYTSEEPKLSKGDGYVEIAIEVLLLAHFWRMMDAQMAMQRMIITLQMISPFNLETLRDVALRTGLQELVEHCDDFAERNADLIQRVKENPNLPQKPQA